eukprot:1154338_1
MEDKAKEKDLDKVQQTISDIDEKIATIQNKIMELKADKAKEKKDKAKKKKDGDQEEDGDKEEDEEKAKQRIAQFKAYPKEIDELQAQKAKEKEHGAKAKVIADKLSTQQEILQQKMQQKKDALEGKKELGERRDPIAPIRTKKNEGWTSVPKAQEVVYAKFGRRQKRMDFKAR